MSIEQKWLNSKKWTILIAQNVNWTKVIFKPLVHSTKHYMNNKSIAQVIFYLTDDQLNKSQSNIFLIEQRTLWIDLISSKSSLNT